MSKEGVVIGSVLRARQNTKPVFVSPGHRMDTESSRAIALECARGYRIPEPTRRADIYVAGLKREVSSHA